MSIEQTQARLLMAVWVIKRRYPNMPEDEVDKRACQIVPTSLSGVDVIDPKSFYLNPRSKVSSKAARRKRTEEEWQLPQLRRLSGLRLLR